MMKNLVFTLSFALAIATLGFAELVEETRQCSLEQDRVVCIDNFNVIAEGNSFQLTCGGNGQVISKVVFASFGIPSGTCISANGLNFTAADLNFSATPGCDAVNSKKVIENACLQKEECSINVGGAFNAGTDGLGSCGNLTIPTDLFYSVHVECGDPFDLFQILIALVIAIIGIGLGATLTPAAVKEAWKLHKKAIIVGWLSQFGFMPLIAFCFAKIMNFDPKVALGVMLVGSSPGGVTSNLFTYWARGNVAVSIMMSVASTLCSLFMLPLLVLVYVEKGLQVNDSIDVPFVEIIQTLLIAIIPVFLGVLIRYKNEHVAVYVERAGSIFGVLFILAALVTGALDNPELFNPKAFPKTWIASIFFQPLGASFGYLAARIMGLTGPEIRAVTLETAIQNYTIAITIITFTFDGCERIVALTFVLVATFMYIVNSIWLVLLLRYMHTRFDQNEESKVDVSVAP